MSVKMASHDPRIELVLGMENLSALHPASLTVTHSTDLVHCSQEECGCGIVFGTDPSGSLVCRSFVPGGPAESSGLVQMGDVLASVDGCDVLRKPVSQVAVHCECQQVLVREHALICEHLKRRQACSAGCVSQ